MQNSMQLSGFTGLPSPEQTAETTPMIESFGAMVERLFKDSGDWNVDVMHAAVGISGELAEVLTAKSKENFIEECGDIEFYLVALEQNLLLDPNFQPLSQEEATRIQDHISDREASFIIGPIKITGDLLDLAKKQWIYNKEPDILGMRKHLIDFKAWLNLMYETSGITQVEVRKANMAKLQKRYPLGYSDKAAQERADKPTGE